MEGKKFGPLRKNVKRGPSGMKKAGSGKRTLVKQNFVGEKGKIGPTNRERCSGQSFVGLEHMTPTFIHNKSHIQEDKKEGKKKPENGLVRKKEASLWA